MTSQHPALQPIRRRILVLACSGTKTTDVGMIAAFRRYDGPAYRLLRQHYSGLLWAPGKEGELSGLSVYVLSAKHGLIPAYAVIRHYDQRMTPELESWLAARDPFATKFRLLLNEDPNLYVVAGADYRAVLNAWAGGRRYHHATGGIGEQLGQLKAWLVRVTHELRARSAPAGTQFELFPEAA